MSDKKVDNTKMNEYREIDFEDVLYVLDQAKRKNQSVVHIAPDEAIAVYTELRDLRAAAGRMRWVLAELFFRNPQRHDGHAYELNLVGWGLGLKKSRPSPEDFLEPVPDVAQIATFVQDMQELYERYEEEEEG